MPLEDAVDASFVDAVATAFQEQGVYKTTIEHDFAHAYDAAELVLPRRKKLIGTPGILIEERAREYGGQVEPASLGEIALAALGLLGNGESPQSRLKIFDRYSDQPKESLLHALYECKDALTAAALPVLVAAMHAYDPEQAEGIVERRVPRLVAIQYHRTFWTPRTPRRKAAHHDESHITVITNADGFEYEDPRGKWKKLELGENEVAIFPQIKLGDATHSHYRATAHRKLYTESSAPSIVLFI